MDENCAHWSSKTIADIWQSLTYFPKLSTAVYPTMSPVTINVNECTQLCVICLLQTSRACMRNIANDNDCDVLNQKKRKKESELQKNCCVFNLHFLYENLLVASRALDEKWESCDRRQKICASWNWKSEKFALKLRTNHMADNHKVFYGAGKKRSWPWSWSHQSWIIRIQIQKNFINDQKNMRLIAKIAFDFKAAGVEPQQVGQSERTKCKNNKKLSIYEFLNGCLECMSKQTTMLRCTQSRDFQFNVSLNFIDIKWMVFGGSWWEIAFILSLESVRLKGLSERLKKKNFREPEQLGILQICSWTLRKIQKKENSMKRLKNEKKYFCHN